MMQLFSQLSPDGSPSPFGGDLFSGMGGGNGSSQQAAENDGAAGNEAAGGGLFGGANPLDMLKGMLSPEQQAMFEMFQTSMNGS